MRRSASCSTTRRTTVVFPHAGGPVARKFLAGASITTSSHHGGPFVCQTQHRRGGTPASVVGRYSRATRARSRIGSSLAPLLDVRTGMDDDILLHPLAGVHGEEPHADSV